MAPDDLGTTGRPEPHRWAYPLVLLLTTALLGGCAGTRPTAGPTGDPAAVPSTPGGGGPATPPAGDASPAGTAPPAGPGASPTGTPPGPRTDLRYVFPVRGRASYHPTHSAYPATDIFAACGTPVLAVTDGRILEVSRVDRFDSRRRPGPDNGGKSVSLLGDDGVRYYGSHLTEVAAGLAAGVRVRAGQQVGTVGRTGNANNVCHLHFGISPPCREIGDWWTRRGVVWPARYLDAWRKGQNRSPAGEVATQPADRGCPAEPD